MKIYSKSIKKLVVIQYYNEFKEVIESISKDISLINAINEIHKLGINEVYLPKEFEAIVHRNIVINTSDSVNVSNALNLEQIYKELCHAFDKKSMENNTLSKELFMTANTIKLGLAHNISPEIVLDDSINTISTDRSKKLSDYTCCLLENTWPIIEQYFPLMIYGLPTKNFFNNLFSLVSDNIIEPESEIYFHENHDVYGVEIILENEILKQIIHDHGIDLNNELIERGYAEKAILLSSILDNTKVGYIRVEPITVSKNLKDKADKVTDSLNKTFSTVQNEFAKEYKKEIEPIDQLAKLYIDPVFNKKMDFNQIRTYLRKNGIGATKGDNQIKMEISYIAEIGDLEIIHENLKIKEHKREKK